MTKKAMIIIAILLAAALGFLLYLYFSVTSTQNTAGNQNMQTENLPFNTDDNLDQAIQDVGQIDE